MDSTFVPKATHPVCRAIGVIFPRFQSSYWTVWRWPFCRARIYYPTSVHDPLDTEHAWVVRHERRHIAQIAPWYGFGLILAYLAIPWVRWLMERGPYLADIRSGHMTIEQVVLNLSRDYWVLLPRDYMRRWFKRKSFRGTGLNF